MTRLSSLLQYAARAHPERGFRFLSRGSVEDSLSYSQLDLKASRVASRLLEEGLRVGERALLVFPPGLDFVVAFWGCLYAGLVAVPAPPPHPARLQRTLPRLRAIAADCRPDLLLTNRKVEGLPAELAPRALSIEEIESEPALPRPGSPLAILQYTSGSTREPRGVMVTEANLRHNLEMLADFHGRQQAMVMVHWLPFYHDMGLVRGMLSPVHMAADCVIMDPMEFVHRPLRWLQALSDFRATVTGAPDFGYALVNRKVGPGEVAGLDLSSLDLAFCSAEPIQASSLRRFGELLAPYGLRRSALKPAYGLAEGTVMVSGELRAEMHSRIVSRSALSLRVVRPAQDQADALEVVCCGQPLGGQQVLIVDEERHRCGALRVGEVWLRGPSVSPGYWNRSHDPAFDARLADGEGPFLATGDLGWLDSDGSLTICGRLKDLIIVRGQNYYPQDIEKALEEAVPSLRPGNVVAFSREDGGVVVVAEARQPTNDVARAVWEAAGTEFGLSLAEVILLAPGELPKTASGKLQRRQAAAAHKQEELAPAIHWRAPRRQS